MSVIHGRPSTRVCASDPAIISHMRMMTKLSSVDYMVLSRQMMSSLSSCRWTVTCLNQDVLALPVSHRSPILVLTDPDVEQLRRYDQRTRDIKAKLMLWVLTSDVNPCPCPCPCRSSHCPCPCPCPCGSGPCRCSCPYHIVLAKSLFSTDLLPRTRIYISFAYH